MNGNCMECPCWCSENSPWGGVFPSRRTSTSAISGGRLLGPGAPGGIQTQVSIRPHCTEVSGVKPSSSLETSVGLVPLVSTSPPAGGCSAPPQPWGTLGFKSFPRSWGGSCSSCKTLLCALPSCHLGPEHPCVWLWSRVMISPSSLWLGTLWGTPPLNSASLCPCITQTTKMYFLLSFLTSVLILLVFMLPLGACLTSRCWSQELRWGRGPSTFQTMCLQTT